MPTRSAPLNGYVVLGGIENAWGLAGGCDCGGSCGCSGLGAITPEQAVEQVFPRASVTGRAGFRQADWDRMAAAARAGQILDAENVPAYVPGSGDCSATGVSSDVKLAQTASGLALTGASIGLTTAGVVTAAALAPWTLGLSALIGLFPLLFSHHAKAVKKEQSVLCSAVPAANNALRIIDQAIAGGQFPPQHGIDALNSLYSDFTSAVSSITQSCNAACIMSEQLKSIVLFKQSQYQDMVNAAPAMTSGSGPTSGVVTSGSTLTIPQAGSAPAGSSPNWLGIAALIAIGFVASRFL